MRWTPENKNAAVQIRAAHSKARTSLLSHCHSDPGFLCEIQHMHITKYSVIEIDAGIICLVLFFAAVKQKLVWG